MEWRVFIPGLGLVEEAPGIFSNRAEVVRLPVAGGGEVEEAGAHCFPRRLHVSSGIVADGLAVIEGQIVVSSVSMVALSSIPFLVLVMMNSLASTCSFCSLVPIRLLIWLKHSSFKSGSLQKPRPPRS